MPPQSPDQNQAPQSALPNSDVTPAAPTVSVAPQLPQKSHKKLFIILAILLVVALAGGAYALFSGGDDTGSATNQSTQPQDSDNQTAAQDDETPHSCPEGFTQFEGNNIGLHFCYPASWGNASLEETGEQAHAVRGNQYRIVFSRNDSVYGGIVSTDWEHNDMGHDGGDWAGSMSFAQLQEEKNYIKAAHVYTDTDTQFAYISACAEFCSLDSNPYLQLTYGVKIPDNDRFEVVVFNQKAEFGDEFRVVDTQKDPGNPISYVDMDKVNAADLTRLLPKSDSRFIVLQQLASTVRN